MVQTTILNSILFVLGAFVMGFFAAIPIGASQIEIAKRALNGYIYSALMIAVGTTLSDTMYGIIAFFGIAPFLNEPIVIAIFRLINSIILIILGIWAILGSKVKEDKKNLSQELLKKKKIAFITGFSLALTNPMIMLWWLIGLHFFISVGIIEQSNTFNTIVFLLAGVAGIASYQTLLTLIVYKSKKFFSEKGVRRLMIILGWALIVFALYFIYLAYVAFVSLK
ncbi:MAG TPA: LysE family transporter [Ignavibacteria bacterium]